MFRWSRRAVRSRLSSMMAYGVHPCHFVAHECASLSMVPSVGVEPTVCLLPERSGYASSPTTAQEWCEREELNLHAFRRQILSLVRLPVSPRSQINHCGVLLRRRYPRIEIARHTGFNPLDRGPPLVLGCHPIGVPCKLPLCPGEGLRATYQTIFLARCKEIQPIQVFPVSQLGSVDADHSLEDGCF